ncbi:unnamed protein product [Pleuronectes platessa]|uniref:Uncharacterized protein n=1 Tax=Pleuronectes platessa TaxID=8262 RepID=A0A9N7ZDY4_PLEPL|nr:unnamed protein product [Pleuronectes platessa]
MFPSTNGGDGLNTNMEQWEVHGVTIKKKEKEIKHELHVATEVSTHKNILKLVSVGLPGASWWTRPATPPDRERATGWLIKVCNSWEESTGAQWQPACFALRLLHVHNSLTGYQDSDAKRRRKDDQSAPLWRNVNTGVILFPLGKVLKFGRGGGGGGGGGHCVFLDVGLVRRAGDSLLHWGFSPKLGAMEMARQGAGNPGRQCESLTPAPSCGCFPSWDGQVELSGEWGGGEYRGGAGVLTDG